MCVLVARLTQAVQLSKWVVRFFFVDSYPSAIASSVARAATRSCLICSRTSSSSARSAGCPCFRPRATETLWVPEESRPTRAGSKDLLISAGYLYESDLSWRTARLSTVASVPYPTRRAAQFLRAKENCLAAPRPQWFAVARRRTRRPTLCQLASIVGAAVVTLCFLNASMRGGYSFGVTLIELRI